MDDWTRFRAISRLERKYDETLTEYLRAFCAMCKKACGRKLTEEEEVAQAMVEPISEERARRCLERLELLCKIREEVLSHSQLEERIKLCQPSVDMPDWWVCGKHDRDLLMGAAKHGLGPPISITFTIPTWLTARSSDATTPANRSSTRRRRRSATRSRML